MCVCVCMCNIMRKKWSFCCVCDPILINQHITIVQQLLIQVILWIYMKILLHINVC